MTTDVPLPQARYGITGYIMLILGLAGMCAFLLFIFQNELVAWKITKRMAWVTWGSVFSFLLVLAIIFSLVQRKKYKNEQAPYRPENVLRDHAIQNTQKKGVVRHFPQISEIRSALRHLYGPFWSRKTRILLVTGTTADAEQLTPGLTTQLWQEDQGTLLLWAGDLSSPPDTPWLTALRTLRRRPADGLLWVTTAFDRLSGPGLTAPAAPLSDDALDSLAHALSALTRSAGWTLPLYVWSLHPRAGEQTGRITQAVGCLLPAGCQAEALSEHLAALTPGLISQGVQQVSGAPQQDFLLTLAEQLTHEPRSVTGPLSVLLNPYRPLPLAGVVFSPVVPGTARTVTHHLAMDNRWDVLPASVRELPPALRPCRTGINWPRILASASAVLMVLWGGWMGVSYVSNRNLINGVQQQVMLAAAADAPLAERLHALLALQKTLSRLQYRSEHRVPWHTRGGLSQNDALLAALWPHYRDSALPLLRDASAAHLERQLKAFVSLPPESPQRERLAGKAREQLKLYLMLSLPARMEAGWFSTALLQHWPGREGLSGGEWQGMAPSLLRFYGTALAAHPQWRLSVDEGVVSRALLVRLTGVRNSESVLYQKMLSQVSHLYADMRVGDMTGETEVSRLFTTDRVVPGIFTRAAWEQAVQPAIDRVVKTRREETDWILSGGQQPLRQAASEEALKARLTARYFADFGGAWQDFLNSLRWTRPASLSEATEQLALMADVRQSPLVALMNTLNDQGRTGQTGGTLADSLVRLAGGEGREGPERNSGMAGPLDETFGPVLGLLDKENTGAQGQSLAAWLTRVTRVRLRLQQVTNAADPQAMSRTLAEAVFQGKGAELTETREYGSLTAAGLGQAWSGFGQTVFVQPLEEAWRQLLAPAAAGLNAQWRQGVVREWNSAFGGRYPFSNTGSEVSLPLLAKYLNGDSGRIAQFVQSRLGGVLQREGNHWVVNSLNAQGLRFNPAFLEVINRLSGIADVAFTEGNAGMRFELRPGTSSGVVQTEMIIDGQKLRYGNEVAQWKRISWPGDTEGPGAVLSWISTDAGTRQYGEMAGSWGWIRLLEKAEVSGYGGMESSWRVRWKAQDGRWLNYTLRTEAGEGPLELLKLRGLRMPETIFIEGTSRMPGDVAEMEEQE